MSVRQLVDAGAQSTVSGAITASQTSVVVQSATGFPSFLSNGQFSVTILDSGNPAYNSATPLATPYEYQPVNFISGNTIQFGVGGGVASRAAFAGTTPHAYFAGATVAATVLAEDIVASAPWKFDDQLVSGSAASVVIPVAGSFPIAAYLGTLFRHIEVVFSARDTSAGTVADLMLLRINGDAGANYSDDFIRSLGGTAAGNQNLSQTFMHVGIVCNGGLTAGLFSAGRLRFPYYTQTDRQKNCVGEAQAQTSTATAVYTQGGFWFTTNTAIQTLTFSPSNGSFAGGTAFTTYLIP